MTHRNRLSSETSPYLLQHAGNPVDWYPWGPEATERAVKEGKPVFLSVGYSACHWCHVMERESFEDEKTAKLLNDSFVCVKVDREERPDIDHLYMTAVQLMTHSGGWPMSVFLTPALQPFYAGTYFPPEDRHGLPAFPKVIQAIASAWKSRREELEKSGAEIVKAVVQIQELVRPSKGAPTLGLCDDAIRQLSEAFDPKNGGFGGAPKFFHTTDLRICLRHWWRTGDAASLAMVTTTLDRLCDGGIYDHLGGGFHRYSTDERWLVPHFEKMLYDNALLAEVLLEAYQAVRRPRYAQAARETLDYLLREMTSPTGGFFATQDADTEGVEGKFYVWTSQEIRSVLEGDLADQFCAAYGVTSRGNWEGKAILHRQRPLAETAVKLGIEPEWLEDALGLARRKLLAARSRRPAPARDEKILVAWNGLAISAMARGYSVLGEPRYLAAASAAARFILEMMTRAGRGNVRSLLHAYKDGRGRFNACLDDYGALLGGLASLYEADGDGTWLRHASQLADVMIDQFWDESKGVLFYTARDHEALVARMRENSDGATPSATGLAVTAVIRIARLCGREDWLAWVERVCTSLEPQMRHAPRASGQLLLTLELLQGKAKELVLVAGSSAEDLDAARHALAESFIPNKVVAVIARDADRAAVEATVPLFRQRPFEDEIVLYACESFACSKPVKGRDAVVKYIEGMGRK